MTGTTLITGADGYLGRRIAAELLAGSDDVLLLAVRAADPGELAAKRGLLDAELGPSALGRTTVVPADLRGDDAFDWADPYDTARITRIVHAAAVTRFNVDRDTARRVNVEGTARVADFARRCGGLRRFALLSTLYAAGRRSGIVKEERHDDAGFVNHYEWSKWAAEEHVLDACADLPLSVLRLPTVIADDDGGRVTQYNAYHNTLKLYFYGLLSLVPGDERTPLHFATARFTTAAVTRLLDPAAPEGIYHVCPDPPHNATLGELIDTIFEVYERDERFRRRRLLRPVWCTRDSFDDLVEVAEHLKGGPIHDSLGSVSPFAHQLYLPKEFRNDALRAVWEGYAAPDPPALLRATAEHLVASRWGREEGRSP